MKTAESARRTRPPGALYTGRHSLESAAMVLFSAPARSFAPPLSFFFAFFFALEPPFAARAFRSFAVRTFFGFDAAAACACFFAASAAASRSSRKLRSCEQRIHEQTKKAKQKK